MQILRNGVLLHISSQDAFQWHCICSLKLAIIQYFYTTRISKCYKSGILFLFSPFFPSLLLPFLPYLPYLPSFFFLKTFSSIPKSTRKTKNDKEKVIANWNWQGQEQEEKGFKEMIENHGLAPRLSISLLDGSEWISLRHMGQLNRTNWHSPVFQSVSDSPQLL